MAKTRRTRPPVTRSRLIPIKDLKSSTSDFSLAPRLDGPIGSAGIRPGRKRQPTGATRELSLPQWIQGIAAFAPLWELASTIDDQINAEPRCGRPTTITAIEMLLVNVAAWFTGSVRSATRFFDDPMQWRLICEAAVRAFPDDHSRRLNPSGISRSQYARFRKRHLESIEAIEDVKLNLEAAFIEIATTVGMFDTTAGTTTFPATQNMLCGDGTWIPSMFNSSDSKYVDPATGEVITLRHDPGSSPYRHNSQANGRMQVSLTARNPFPNERMIIAFGFSPPSDVGEATVATDMVLRVAQNLPGLQGLVYDMALHAPDYDRLLEAGLLPIVRTQRTNRGEPPMVDLGQHVFTRTDGTKVEVLVQAWDGNPCIPQVVGEVPHLALLERVRVKRSRSRTNKYRFYGVWKVPDLPGIDRRLRGATCLIRHNSTAEEIDGGKRRTRALRVVPELDPDFGRLAGSREDIESMHHNEKSGLTNRRARSVGPIRQLFDIAGYQVIQAMKTLLAWNFRTGGDIGQWFGRWRPPERLSAKAA